MAALDPQRKSLIENEFARFSIWSSNIGIFASGRASMDDRLRGEPSIKRLVLGLLEVLQGRIKQCMFCIAFLPCLCISMQYRLCSFEAINLN